MSEKKNEKKVSLKDKMRAGGKTTRELVDIPEMDCTVEVREFGGITRGQVIRETNDLTGEDFQTALFRQLLLTCIFDPDTGKLLFQESDIDWLMEKKASILESMIVPAIRMNGLMQSDVDEEAKN